MTRPRATFERVAMLRIISSAFTLIELLVVITIIVVLLALLTPAIDRSIYAADLARCGAKLKGLATATVTYTVSYNRAYPRHDTPDFYTPYVLANKWANGGADLRLWLAKSVPVQAMLNDPLCTPANLQATLSAPPNGIVFGSYTLFFGYTYTGEKAMMRLGDRWTYGTDTFSLIAGDYLMSHPDIVYSTHPSRDASLNPELFDNQDFQQKYGASGAAVFASTQGAKYTYTRWIGSVDDRRKLDHNYAYEDGSVRRLDGLSTSPADSRVTRVSLYKTKDPLYNLLVPQE
jgi:prepilin-type N-terminal cleavage/methylation domain-containing protein